MLRYFIHLVDSNDVLLDPEGILLASDAVEAKALQCARDCMAGDVMQGELDLRYRIEVQDEAGDVVHRLEFADAIRIKH